MKPWLLPSNIGIIGGHCYVNFTKPTDFLDDFLRVNVMEYPKVMGWSTAFYMPKICGPWVSVTQTDPIQVRKSWIWKHKSRI